MNAHLDRKTTESYWSRIWAGEKLPRPLQFRKTATLDFANRCFDLYFKQCFKGMKTTGRSLVEIGCASSVWLPYFAKQFRFDVSGLDYSEIGCARTRKILESTGVDGKIICSDLFDFPLDWAEKFDVAISIGLVEHFDNTATCIKAIAELIKPGGHIITIIPNMGGMIGGLQRILNTEIYELHVQLDPARLRSAHLRAGLTVLNCNYFMFTKFSVGNIGFYDNISMVWVLKKLIWSVSALISAASWWIEDRTFCFNPNKYTSPYIVCFAHKPL